MVSDKSNNKRIAKNTLFLYFRTFIIMLISLYTSRVVLNVLGETDFGIYNIVGGVVVLFSFLNSAMATATQRFLNYYLGKQDECMVKRVFSTSLTVHIVIALIVVILAETIGLWFFYEKLNIPSNRIIPAMWAYQFSVVTCCLQIIRIPYNAAIIAYERMSFYAYISIVEAILRLAICYLLIVGSIDKLVLYSILTCLVFLLINVAYQTYCLKHYWITKYQFVWDKGLFTKLLGFSGWSLLGSTANVGVSQGINILFNIFVGVVANAAMGISHQIMTAVTSFVGSFQTAFTPQLVKSFAAGEKQYFEQLVFRTSRLSFFLIWIIGLPMIICMNTILTLWLGNVPNYTTEFSCLLIIYCMIDSCSGPLWNAVQAKGDIKKYQITVSSIILSNLVFAYIFLKMGISPVYVIIVRALLNVGTHFYRIYFLKLMMQMPILEYMKSVMLPIIAVVIFSLPIPILVRNTTDGITGTILTLFVSFGVCLITIIVFGLTKEERKYATQVVKSKIKDQL